MMLFSITVFMAFTIPQTYPWACITSAFAMACGIPWKDFLQYVGHDGSRFPYKDPSIRAGFHIQECIEVAQQWGWTCTPIELFPISTPGNGEEIEILFGDETGNWARFLQHLTTCQTGVIEGVVSKQEGSVGHAVAWDGTKIHDPKGKVYSFAEHSQHNFFPRVLWKLAYVGVDDGS
jgi:hypothetical protein